MTSRDPLTPRSPPRGSINRSVSYQITSSDSQRLPPSSSSTGLHQLAHHHHYSVSSAHLARIPFTSQHRHHTSSSPSLSSSSRQRSSSVGAGNQTHSHHIDDTGVGSGDESRDASFLSPLAMMGHELDRGPGTPDFVLGFTPKRRSTTSRQDKGKGRLEEIRKSGDECGSVSTPPSPLSTTTPPSASSRPRLTTRVRSFLTSFTGGQRDGQDAIGEDEVPDGGPSCSSSKLRSSSESNRQRRDSSSNILVVPFARPAGMASFGSLGLNDASPPLTPNSNGDERLYSHPWEYSPRYSAPPTDTTPGTSRADSPSPHGGTNTSLGLLGVSEDVLVKPLSATAARAYGMHRLSQRLPITSLRVLAANVETLLQAGLRSRTLHRNMPTLLMLLTVFVSATLVVFLLLTTLPLRMPSHGLTQLSLAEIRDVCLSLKEYTASTSRAYHHTLFVLCLFYTYKQAFNVPGSIISNVVFGALFGVWRATFWLSIFTAVGGSGAAVMSALVAPLVLKLPGMQKAVAMMRKALGSKNLGRTGVKATISGSQRMRKRSPNASRSGTPRTPHRAQSPHPSHKTKAHHSTIHSVNGRGNLFSILLILRLLPFTPYGVMNIACGILNVPLLPFGVTLAMGSIPWNAVTAQVGEILVEVVAAIPGESASGAVDMGASGATLAEQLDSGGFHDVISSASGNATSFPKSHILSSAAHKAGGGVKVLLAKIWTREMMLKMVGLSLLSVTPVLLGKWWKARQARSAKASRKARSHALITHHNHGPQQPAEQPQVQPNLLFTQGMPTPSADRGPFLHTPLAGPSTASAAAVLDWSDGEDQEDDDGEEGYAVSSEEEYDSSDEYAFAGAAGEDDEDEDTDMDEDDRLTISSAKSSSDVIKNSSANPQEKSLSIFSATTVATLAVGTGPAFVAQLTRSASRNGWNRSTAAWFGGGAGGSEDRSRSRSPGNSQPEGGREAMAMIERDSAEEGHTRGDSVNVWPAALTTHPTVVGVGRHNLTPQLEAQNPFKSLSYPRQQSYRDPLQQGNQRLLPSDSRHIRNSSTHQSVDREDEQSCREREPRRLTAVVR